MKLPRYLCHKEVGALKIEEVRPETLPKWKKATCRGCFALGSACGHCERCSWELEHGSAMRTLLVPSDPAYDPFWVSSAYVLKHKPEAGGYYVVYPDGYESFSPAAAFEGGYMPILKATQLEEGSVIRVPRDFHDAGRIGP